MRNLFFSSLLGINAVISIGFYGTTSRAEKAPDYENPVSLPNATDSLITALLFDSEEFAKCIKNVKEKHNLSDLKVDFTNVSVSRFREKPDFHTFYVKDKNKEGFYLYIAQDLETGAFTCKIDKNH